MKNSLRENTTPLKNLSSGSNHLGCKLSSSASPSSSTPVERGKELPGYESFIAEGVKGQRPTSKPIPFTSTKRNWKANESTWRTQTSMVCFVYHGRPLLQRLWDVFVPMT